MADYTLEIRKAVMAHLIGGAVAIGVPAARIYGVQPPANPTWPLIRYGLPITTPYENSCGEGTEARVTIHVFARGDDEEPCATIGKAVVARMSALGSISGLSLIDNTHVSSQILRDSDEAGEYHGVIEFRLIVTGQT